MGLTDTLRSTQLHQHHPRCTSSNKGRNMRCILPYNDPTEMAHTLIDATVTSQLGAACAGMRDNRPGRLTNPSTAPSTVRIRPHWLRPRGETDVYHRSDLRPCTRISQLPLGLRKGTARRHWQLSADRTLTTILAGDATLRPRLTRPLVISKGVWRTGSGRSAAGSFG